MVTDDAHFFFYKSIKKQICFFFLLGTRNINRKSAATTWLHKCPQPKLLHTFKLCTCQTFLFCQAYWCSFFFSKMPDVELVCGTSSSVMFWCLFAAFHALPLLNVYVYREQWSDTKRFLCVTTRHITNSWLCCLVFFFHITGSTALWVPPSCSIIVCQIIKKASDGLSPD